MRLYFAGYSSDQGLLKIKEADCLLESYLVFANRDYVKWHTDRGLLGKKLFLDSGAFSAFTLGKTINIAEYCDFIKRNQSLLEVYAGLDVIGDFQKSRTNQEWMEAQGLSPLPCFHFKSPLQELKRMCEKYDYIALGGLVPLALKQKTMTVWLDNCFSIIKHYWPKKIHGFGLNSFDMWTRYPFYSVDSTSWLMGGKFRHIIKFNGEKILSYSKKNITTKSLEVMNAYQQDYQDINTNNVVEYLKAADFATRLWEARNIKW